MHDSRPGLSACGPRWATRAWRRVLLRLGLIEGEANSKDPNGRQLGDQVSVVPDDEHKTETVIGVNRPFDMIVARNSGLASTAQLSTGLAGNTAAEPFSSYPTKT